MRVPSILKNLIQDKTRRVLLWMNLSHEPFVVLYALLPFIFRKDLGASLLQISILTALRPLLPVFSFYWSSHLTSRRVSLKTNLIVAWALARIPFLFVPWIDNPWYLIFCCGVFELFNKSGIPALIEILKINIPKEGREKTYSFYFVLSFLESILLGIFMAKVLDQYSSAWKILCAASALLGLSSIFVQMSVPVPEMEPPKKKEKLSLSTSIVQPWKEAFALLKSNREFTQFQYGFMIGGVSLMLIAPSLSIFYVDTLKLSHSDIVTGRSILMGIGIVLSSFIWRRLLAKKSVAELTRWILVGFSLFPLSLLLTPFHMFWFYFSFFLYGIAQAGSHLLWNLSGTIFSGQDDSSPYTRVNILMVGLRGAVAPALGGIVCDLFGPVPMLMIGAAVCLGGVAFMSRGLTKAHA
jgi:predicted MFS family arabinose efflux permease